MKLMSRLCFLLLGLAAALSAQTPEQRIEHALLTNDDAALSTELATLEARLVTAPQDSNALYFKGLILCHRATVLRGKENEARAKALFLAAEKALDAALQGADSAEARALRASVLERSIGVKGAMSAMTLGPRAAKDHDRALAAAPQNPRVAMLHGISLLNRPGFTGGSVEKAQAEFQRAVTLFAQPGTPTDASALTWGHAEAWAWLGIAHARQGHFDEARAAYTRALELAPDYAWVKRTLLPALDKKEKGA